MNLPLRHVLYWGGHVREGIFLFSIGKLAKLSNTTVRTLRYYDEIGLLTPAKISEGSHRYYDNSAVVKLHNIILLKGLGFELETIQRILAKDIKSSEELLKLRLEILEEELLQLKQQKQKITALLQVIDMKDENDWEAIFNSASSIQQYDHEKITKRWEQLFTKDEQQILHEMPKLGMDDPLGKQWIQLLKETKYHANTTDPASEKGQELAKRWLNIVYVMYKGNWKLAQKVWDINFEKHENIGFYEIDEEVINFIRKAQTYFFKHNMDSVKQVIDYE